MPDIIAAGAPTAFDFVVFGIVAASLLLGLLRGAVSEILALAGWVVALLAAREFALSVGVMYATWLKEPTAQVVAGFATVVIAVLIVFSVLRAVLRRLLRLVGLGGMDRLLGAVFGVARALVIVLVLVLVGGMTALPRAPWWRHAILAAPLETAVIALKPWMPGALAQRVRFR